MSGLQGLVLDGLDEFMLRLGHLKLLCGVSAVAGGGLHRIEREVALRLVTDVTVPDDSAASMARYLIHKRLCRVIADGIVSDPGDGGRYPDISVITVGDHYRIEARGPAQVTWQDYCLAQPEVVSRVGAVTTRAKSGSKTGLSHVLDWAVMAGLFTRSGEPTPDAQLVGALSGNCEPSTSHNPYIIGSERIILGYTLLSADFDLFARLLPALLRSKQPITKSTGTQIFIETVRALADEAEADRNLSSHRAYAIFQIARELPGSGTMKRSSSTAWHRVASRLETYVDLGFLVKPVDRQYEYVYEPAPHMSDVVKTLEEANGADAWLGRYLVLATTQHEPIEELLPPDVVLAAVPFLQAALGRKSGPIPMLTVAFALLCSGSGPRRSLAGAIASVENLAIKHPESARLSRGGSGFGAQYISFRKD